MVKTTFLEFTNHPIHCLLMPRVSLQCHLPELVLILVQWVDTCFKCNTFFFNQVPGSVKSKCWQKIVFSRSYCHRHCIPAPNNRGLSAIWEKSGGGSLGGKKAKSFSGGAGGGDQVLDAWHGGVHGEEDQGGGGWHQDGARPHHGRLLKVGQKDPKLTNLFGCKNNSSNIYFAICFKIEKNSFLRRIF